MGSAQPDLSSVQATAEAALVEVRRRAQEAQVRARNGLLRSAQAHDRAAEQHKGAACPENFLAAADTGYACSAVTTTRWYSGRIGN